MIFLLYVLTLIAPIFFIATPIITIPFLYYSTLKSIQRRFNFSENKEYLKWDIQKFIICLVTIIFAYKNTVKIYNDFTNFYSTGIDVLSLEYLNRILLYYPYLLFAYYLALFVFYFKNILISNIRSAKQSYSKILTVDKDNISQREYIKLSRFILSAIFFFIWWSYIVFLLNGLGSMAQQ